MKILARYYKKSKESLQTKLVKSIKITLKKRKTKCVSMLMNDIEIFLKKKQDKKQQYCHRQYNHLLGDGKQILVVHKTIILKHKTIKMLHK